MQFSQHDVRLEIIYSYKGVIFDSDGSVEQEVAVKGKKLFMLVDAWEKFWEM
jgi:hypothetical protein